MLALQIYTRPGGALLADFTGRATGLRFSTNGHGFAACDVPLVPMSLSEAFEVYDWPGLPHVVVSDGAAGVVWEGRLEDIEIVAGGVHLTALGYQRALYDAPYTALWSASGSADWRAVTNLDRSVGAPERYEIDNNNRLYVGLKKGESYGHSNHHGELTFALPHRGVRALNRFEADYSITLPSGWEARLLTCDENFGNVVVEATVTATGSNQAGSWALDVSAKARLVFSVRNMTGSTATPAGDSGANFARLTNVRLSTGGASVVASDIAAALAAWTNALNPLQLRGDAVLIEPTATDLRDEVYEDTLPAAILDRLALLHGYEWGVYDDRRLHFRPRGGQRAWYVDVTAAPQLQRSVEGLRNSAYATYRGDDGRTLRTASVGDADSQARYGLVRRGLVNAQTTSLTEAQTHRAVYLADRATLSTRADIAFDRLYDDVGALWPLWSMRAGDTVTMRNLPPTLSTDIDRIRTFRIAETEYDAAADTLSIAPEEPLPRLDVLVARREVGL